MKKNMHKHINFQLIPDTPKGNGREMHNGIEVICSGLAYDEAETRHYCQFTGIACPYKILMECKDFRRHILPRWQAQGKYLIDKVISYIK